MTRAEKYSRDMLIVADRKRGMSMSECAEKYGMTEGDIGHICKRYGVAGVLSSKKCEPPHSHALKITEAQIAERIAKAWPGFEYAGEFKGVDKKCLIRCKTCGHVFERSMISLRNGKNCTCDNCERLKREAKKSEAERLKQLEQERILYEKELRQIRKAKQTFFLVCEECGKLFISTTQNKKYCSSECSHKRSLRRATKRKEHRFDKPRSKLLTWHDVYIHTGSLICAGCGIECDPKSEGNADNHPSIDHIIPASRGGKDEMDNVQIMCRRCNTLKGNQYPPLIAEALQPYGNGDGSLR